MIVPAELLPIEVDDIVTQCALDGAIHNHSFEQVAERTQRGLFWAKEIIGREIPL